MSAGIPFPTIAFNSFNITESDPDIARHIVSGSFAYDRRLGIDDCNTALDFGTITLTGTSLSGLSDVAVINIAFPDLETLNAQSGAPTVVNNMKLYLPSGSGTVLDEPGISLQYMTSGVWLQNYTFPSGEGQEFARSLPEIQNLLRIDGFHSISGFAASEVTEYIYMRLFINDQFPIGSFGSVCGSGLLRPRLVYDFY